MVLKSDIKCNLITSLKSGIDYSFTPNDLDNLLAWYDAADTSSITQSGGKVSKWNDKSRNGKHATEGTVADQPITNATTQNGRNVIDFANLTDLKEKKLDMPVTIGAEATIFYVYKEATQTTGGSAFRAVISPNGTGGFGNDKTGYSLGMSYNNISRLRHYYADTVALSLASETGAYDNAYHTMTMVSSSASGVGKSYNNSSQFGSNATPDRTTGFQTDYTIGGDATNPEGRLYVGSIAEIIVYNRALSDNERLSIEGYLSNKWGIV
jgi:hypothetical protein